MYNSISWLPSPVDSTQYNSQNELIHELYKIFERDFKNLNNEINFKGQLVSHSSLPLYKKCAIFTRKFASCGNTYNCKNCPYITYEDIFNHITCSEFNDKNRTPGIFKLERAIRINWIRPIIENADKSEVFYYERSIKGVLKKCFWLRSEKYIVILSVDAKGRFFLNSGYYLDPKKGDKRIRSNYKDYINMKKTPTAS